MTLLAKTWGKLVGWHIALEWKPQDMWIGVFWRQDGCCVDVRICILPMFPIHVSYWWLP